MKSSDKVVGGPNLKM